MAYQPQRPTAKVQGTQGIKGVEQYLADLETLLKRNTGSGTYQGQDVSSNLPMYIPGRVANPTGLMSTPSTEMFGDGMVESARRYTPNIQQPETQPMVLGASQDQPMSADEFLQQFEQVYSAPENQQQYGDPELEYIASTPDGGQLMADGTIVYEDGTIRQGDIGAQAIASLQDGSVLYSDKSVRKAPPTPIASLAGDRERILYDDNTARWGQYRYKDQEQQDIPGGLEGLVQGIFGQRRPITQAYGNVNPIEPTPGHVNLGTDIRTRDLSGEQRTYKLPVGAKVVQVYRDDGTRFGSQSGHKGYGNSVLLQLPSGEMLRFSHMRSTPSVQPGDTIAPGQVFGAPGTTGNTEGEHLDLEYYNKQGRVDNPKNFSGFTNPQGLREKLPNQQAPGTLTSALPQTYSQEPQNTQQQQPRQDVGRVGVLSAATAPKQQANGLYSMEQSQVDTQDTQGTTQPQEGIAKAYNPFRQLAGNLVERASDVVGLPVDFGISEKIAGAPTKRTGIAQASEIGVNQSQNIPGIRQNIEDIVKSVTDKSQQALSQAGQGISALKGAGTASLENVFQPKTQVEKRAVGDVAGSASTSTPQGQFSSLMDGAPSLTTPQKGDVRDPFFKMGGSETFKSSLIPDAENIYGGALKLDLFKPEFYKDYGNITSVFGGSKDIGAAADKYIDYERQKYPMMSKMSYGDGYDSGDIDRYNQEVDKYNNELQNYFNEVKSSALKSDTIFKPTQVSTNKNIFAQTPPVSIEQPNASFAGRISPRASFAPSTTYSSMARPQVSRPAAASFAAPSRSLAAPQMSVRPGSSAPQMSVAPRVSAPSASRSVPQMSVRPGSRAPQMSVAPRVSAPAPRNFTPAPRASFSAPSRNYTPAPQNRPSSNVFSRAVSSIRNVFRR